MDEEILISQTGNITESLTTGDCVRPGCLGQLKGPIADWNDSTRNKRYYSRRLWERVFETDWVQEALRTRTLFGEADHPEERIEPLLTQAAVVLVDYRFDDDEKMVYGTFDILDTPSGRILRTLADYGCELGVSSRGRGQLVSKNGRQEVDPESYVFGGFDVVALPAVKRARQTFIRESGSREFRLDIVSQIEMCESESDLRTIKSILDNANLSDISKIDRLIESRMSEFNPSEDDTIIDGLTRDLREACDQIRDLRRKLDRIDATGAPTDTIGESEVIGRLREILVENGSTDTIDGSRVVEGIHALIDGLSETVATLTGVEPSEGVGLIRSMTETLESKDSELEGMGSVVNRLRESLDESKTSLSETQRELREANEREISLRTELDSVISEYNELTDDYNTLLAKNRDMVERHLNEQATRLNISRNDFRRLLPEEYDVTDIDDVAESQMRIRRKLMRLPISDGGIPVGETMLESLPRATGGPDLRDTRKILMSMKKGN